MYPCLLIISVAFGHQRKRWPLMFSAEHPPIKDEWMPHVHLVQWAADLRSEKQELGWHLIYTLCVRASPDVGVWFLVAHFRPLGAFTRNEFSQKLLRAAARVKRESDESKLLQLGGRSTWRCGGAGLGIGTGTRAGWAGPRRVGAGHGGAVRRCRRPDVRWPAGRRVGPATCHPPKRATTCPPGRPPPSRCAAASILSRWSSRRHETT